MKQIYTLLVAVCALLFTGCSKDDDVLNDEGGEGVITMVVNAKGGISPDEDVYFYIYSFKENEIITVDWGDGQVEEFRTVVEEEEEEEEEEAWYWTGRLKHSYARHKSYTITIKGNVETVVYEGSDIAPLTSLNVSRCPALKELYCSYNNLTSLDVSKNTALKELECDGNNLTSLDVSKNTALKELYCSHNKLTSLDVSGCLELEFLYCSYNNQTSLDVSKNTALKDLHCPNNNLTSLNVSGCLAFGHLDCRNNKFSARALNGIFTDLPQRHASIRIYGNPGTATCDKSIAEKKGWEVFEDEEW